MNHYTLDLETTTQEDDCHIWAWGCYNIYSEAIKKGTKFDELLQFLLNHGGTYYFHNLAFDGEFFILNLLERGYEWKKWSYNPRPNLKGKYFSTIISGDRKWYATYLQGDGGFVSILDSFKIIPSSISKIAKDFGFKEKKGKIDYHKHRPFGYEPTEEEWEYLENDIIIQGKAMKEMLQAGFKKMTAGSNALSMLRDNFIGKKEFSKLFPSIEKYDGEIRRAYKGGWTYLNPKYKGKIVKSGIVLDVNSMYPYVMTNHYYPYGAPKLFVGKYKRDAMFPLYIQQIQCRFQIKPNHLPTIQLKNSGYFNDTEYLESSWSEELQEDVYTDLYLTNIDLKLFLEHYDVDDLKYIKGWKFKARKEMFNEFVEYWYEKKQEATRTGNKVLRVICKLILNSCYGKFATRIIVTSGIPQLHDGILCIRHGPVEHRQGVYLPVGIFVTSYAREKIIRSAQSVYDRFIYADTDSLHLEGFELPQNLEIDNYKLGAWKHESTFIQAKYLRQKCYFECEVKNSNPDYHRMVYKIYGIPPAFIYNPKITVAGMPDEAKNGLTFEKFNFGYRAEGKKNPRHVKGGLILVDVPYTLNP